MKKNNLLTIGIPTYNRKKTILNCLDNLYKNKIHLKANVLIIDNSSEDQTYDTINKKYSHVFNIFKNKSNIGFSGSTIKLFEICSTEYLLWLPDEDIIVDKNLDRLIEILTKNSYFFLCPQYYLNNNKLKLYRGNNEMKLTSSITYDLWILSSHLPGLIFNVSKTKKIINKFTTLIKNYPNVTKYYPQLFILSDLLIQDYKKCMFLNFEICSQEVFLEDTHDKDFTGTGYGGLVTRWLLHKEFVEYLTDLVNKNNNNNTLKKLLSFQRKRIFNVIRNSLEWEKSDYILDFNKELYKTLIFLPIKFILYLLIKPVFFLKQLYKYFH